QDGPGGAELRRRRPGRHGGPRKDLPRRRLRLAPGTERCRDPPADRGGRPGAGRARHPLPRGDPPGETLDRRPLAPGGVVGMAPPLLPLARQRRSPAPLSTGKEEGMSILLKGALFFFVIALIAALFGFGGIAEGAADIAQVLFFIFLLICAVLFV